MRLGTAMRRARGPRPNNAPKVFVIGFNKTGTTSTEAALNQLGYEIGDQSAGELLLEDWASRRFDSIIDLSRRADAFQDIPFSLDFTFQALDAAFPRSKFILTVRSSSQDWYSSLIRHHQQLLGIDRLPSAEDLRSCSYRRIGWLLEANRLIFGVDDADLYNQSRYISVYERHNDAVLDYFRLRHPSLLVLDVAAPNALASLASFVERPVIPGAPMPHLNRSR